MRVGNKLKLTLVGAEGLNSPSLAYQIVRIEAIGEDWLVVRPLLESSPPASVCFTTSRGLDDFLHQQYLVVD